MDEGVDPKQMCQSLVNKLAQSEQLEAVAHPEILGLFEDWLEELEEEVVAWARKARSRTPEQLSEDTGISRSGAAFVLAKLEREGKI